MYGTDRRTIGTGVPTPGTVRLHGARNAVQRCGPHLERPSTVWRLRRDVHDVLRYGVLQMRLPRV